ncbi:MAG: hypothetical protein R2827_16780, partial [Bdellovibrionales bacterium]
QGSSACTNCSAGRFSSASGADSCDECVPGTFSSEGASSCTNCSVGTFTESSGSTSCTSCRAGTFAEDTGSISCTDCPIDSFQSEEGADSCEECTGDLIYQFESGATECKACFSLKRKKTKLKLRGVKQSNDGKIGKVFLKTASTINSELLDNFDPLEHGIHIVVEDSEGLSIIEADIPGGEFSNDTSLGWTVNTRRRVTNWNYTNTSDNLLSGISKVKLSSKSEKNQTKKIISITISGSDPTYIVSKSSLPLKLAIGLGESKIEPCFVVDIPKKHFCKFRKKKENLICNAR